MEFTIIDGVKDVISGEGYLTPYDSDSQPEPYAIRFKMKPGVTTCDLSIFDYSGAVSGVDWGLNKPIDRSGVSVSACGEEVTVFIAAVELIWWGTGLWMYDTDFGAFFSQMETLYTPLPEWIYTSGTVHFNIDSPDFTAPEGMFANIDITPHFYLDVRDEDSGSNFKQAPRIWSDLTNFSIFPSTFMYPDSSNEAYDPFLYCKHTTVAYQGDFGPKLEALGPVNFMYNDENGYGNPSAYPSGGAPKVIMGYIPEIETYVFESGYPFPQFDMSRCKKLIKPYTIKNLSIGTQTTASGATLPIGINFNDADQLTLLDLELPKVSIQPGNWTGTMYYGAKMLGITIPDSVKIVGGVYDINSNFIVEGFDPTEYPDLNDSAPGDVSPAYPATPEFIKTKVSFTYGYELEKLFEPNELLILPEPSANAQVIDHYARNLSAGSTSPFVAPDPDSISGWGYYSPPALKEGLEVLGSYCKQLYMNQTLGTSSFINDVNPDEEDPNPGPQFIVNGHITIPKLPSTIRICSDYLRETFASSRGSEDRVYFTNESPEIKMHLIYGEMTENPTAYWRTPAVYVDEYWSVGNNDWFLEEFGASYANDKRLGLSALVSHIESHVGTMPETYKVDIMTSGIIIETSNLPNLQIAPNWMRGTWHGAVIDPRGFDNLIVPLPTQVKSENAFRNALSISKPSTNPQVTIIEANTCGRWPLTDEPINGSSGWEMGEPGDLNRRYVRIIALQNPMSPEDLLQWRWTVDDFNLPAFKATNANGKTYNAFQDIFYNVFGSGNAFFQKFGVDSSIRTEVARREYLSLNNASDTSHEKPRQNSFQFSWYRNVASDNSTIRSVPRLYRYRWELPLVGEQDALIEQGLLEYRYHSGGIDNRINSHQETHELTAEWEADNWSAHSLPSRPARDPEW